MTNSDDRPTILLVDDDPANIHVVRAILKFDYSLRIATSGVRALELANAKPFPDLILLDIMMPDLDGYEVCRLLKADQTTREIPVIFLTGKTEVADETRGFEAGAVDYIHKPFSPPIVTARVKNHLLLREARAQLATQLRNINSELELAREIQLSILPHEVPCVEGLEIATRFLPVSSVAGDFYDFLVADQKGVGILVADVTGHGLPAALIASMLKVALSAQAAHASQPDRVLCGLNHALCGMFQKYFVTAIYIYLDLETNALSYSGAGHPPLLLRRESTGEITELLHNGAMLGLLLEEAYSSIEIPLENGDRILLYTDGIVEAMNSSEEQYGLERLKGFLADDQSFEPNNFAQALLAELSHWSRGVTGGSLQDDITLLAVDVKKGTEKNRQDFRNVCSQAKAEFINNKANN